MTSFNEGGYYSTSVYELKMPMTSEQRLRLRIKQNELKI